MPLAVLLFHGVWGCSSNYSPVNAFGLSALFPLCCFWFVEGIKRIGLALLLYWIPPPGSACQEDSCGGSGRLVCLNKCLFPAEINQFGAEWQWFCALSLQPKERVESGTRTMPLLPKASRKRRASFIAAVLGRNGFLACLLERSLWGLNEAIKYSTL